jgi:Ni/Co efflux regulator RcnB
MKTSKCMFTGLLALLFLSASPALAQDHGNGHGKGHDKQHDDDRDDHHDDYYYKHHEKDIRGWYSESGGHLPPGLAKKDQLPPGLEKQLVRRGTLPPGLQKRMYPCPEELERRLPPPPPDCAHILVGGHIVLFNRRTNVVVDIFHFEIN